MDRKKEANIKELLNTISTLKDTLDDLQWQNNSLIKENERLTEINDRLYNRIKSVRDIVNTNLGNCEKADSQKEKKCCGNCDAPKSKKFTLTERIRIENIRKNLEAFDKGFNSDEFNLTLTKYVFPRKQPTANRSYSLVALTSDGKTKDEFSIQFYDVRKSEFEELKKSVFLECIKIKKRMPNIHTVLLLQYDRQENGKFEYTRTLFEKYIHKCPISDLEEVISQISW